MNRTIESVRMELQNFILYYASAEKEREHLNECIEEYLGYEEFDEEETIKVLPLDTDLIIQYTNNNKKYKGIITGFDEVNGVWE